MRRARFKDPFGRASLEGLALKQLATILLASLTSHLKLPAEVSCVKGWEKQIEQHRRRDEAP